MNPQTINISESVNYRDVRKRLAFSPDNTACFKLQTRLGSHLLSSCHVSDAGPSMCVPMKIFKCLALLSEMSYSMKCWDIRIQPRDELFLNRKKVKHKFHIHNINTIFCRNLEAEKSLGERWNWVASLGIESNSDSLDDREWGRRKKKEDVRVGSFQGKSSYWSRRIKEWI